MTFLRSCLFSFLLGLSVGGETVAAQTLQGSEMSIEAQDRFEWRRKENLYIAEGDVTLRSGETVFRADRVLVFYDEAMNSTRGSADSPEIRRVVFEGGVSIATKDGQTVAERAVYDAGKNLLVARGGDEKSVRIEFSEGRKITASKIIYWLSENRMRAEGSVDIVMEGLAFRSNVAQAFFTESERGDIVIPDNWLAQRETRLQIHRLEAEGDILAEIIDAEIRGDKGVFTVAKMEVELCGSVKVAWQNMNFSGDCAVADLQSQNINFHNLADGDESVKISIPLSAFGE